MAALSAIGFFSLLVWVTQFQPWASPARSTMAVIAVVLGLFSFPMVRGKSPSGHSALDLGLFQISRLCLVVFGITLGGTGVGVGLITASVGVLCVVASLLAFRADRKQAKLNRG